MVSAPSDPELENLTADNSRRGQVLTASGKLPLARSSSVRQIPPLLPVGSVDANLPLGFHGRGALLRLLVDGFVPPSGGRSQFCLVLVLLPGAP